MISQNDNEKRSLFSIESSTVLCGVSCPVLQERDAVLGSLAHRASKLVEQLNKLPGVTCNDAEGALYAFPR
jgi:aspartate/methionine/tyrosine aminotransferase